MKKRKIIILCLTFFAGLNILFISDKNANYQNLATTVVEKLNDKIALTDSRKTILLKVAKTYFKNRNTAAKKTKDRLQ
ncbi:MAG: hypothetical protein H6Q15_2139 [Bacteroidetes bacterium]|nr:hypothetical protein [Bacteroidota bacterium]